MKAKTEKRFRLAREALILEITERTNKIIDSGIITNSNNLIPLKFYEEVISISPYLENYKYLRVENKKVFPVYASENDYPKTDSLEYLTADELFEICSFLEQLEMGYV